MKKLTLSLMLLLGSLMITGCDLRKTGATIEQQFSMNEVKLIRPDITRGDDGRTFLQAQYTLGPEARLLLAWDSFLDHASTTSVQEGKKVRVRIGIPSSQNAPAAQTALALCPVTTNWMMLATWRYAHNIDSSGRWRADGGDFEEAGCVSGAYADSVLEFDMTAWFIDYVRGRNQNYGLILKSSEIVTIYGDLSGSFSPRILFHE